MLFRSLRDALGLERDPRFELWFLQADCAVIVEPDAAGRRDLSPLRGC